MYAPANMKLSSACSTVCALFIAQLSGREHRAPCSFAANLVMLLVTLVCLSSSEARADSSGLKRFFPKSFANSIFAGESKPIHVGNAEEDAHTAAVRMDGANGVTRAGQDKEVNHEGAAKDLQQQLAVKGPQDVEFSTSDVTKKTFLPPDQTPPVPINPNAPASAISMIESNRRGDSVTAKAYAKQFVRVLQNYFFEVKQITSLIGEALIEENVIQEEDWIGAEQRIDIEMAKTRLERGVPIRPTHDVAMRRVVADPKKEVEVYYLFGRMCSYCRMMSADVERLRLAFEEDTRVNVTGVVVGPNSEEWLREFREYTGLQIPVFDGTEFAKKLHIGYLPALLIVEPNGERSYVKTGQQTFEHMYEFVRTAQGLKVEDSSRLQQIVRTPVGEREKLIVAKGGKNVVIAKHFGEKQSGPVRMPNRKSRKKVEVDTF